MSSPWNRGPGGRSRRTVPYETAKKLADQRDKLAEKVRELRERVQTLSSQLEEEREAGTDADDAQDALRERAEAAEQRARELESKLEEVSVDEPVSGEETSSEGEEEEVRRLRERVATLGDEVDRLRRRAERAAEEARQDERRRLLSGLGDALESIERGLSMHPEGPEREGLEAIYSQLLGFLRREGATLTGEVGEPMDPKRHEAIDAVESPEAESGTILDVARKGVVLDDGTVVLPAKVQVAR